MSNNKQSSVEWLIDYLKNLEKYPYKTIQQLEEQAKEMHKEEIMKFAEDWGKSNLDCKEDLYTETFNNE
jgi:hypothetical protein